MWTLSRTRHRSHVLTLPYDEVLALYFENRQFGFCFLQLASGGLLKDKARAEDALAAERAASATNTRWYPAWRTAQHALITGRRLR